jgi:hypothetical protein
MTPPAPHIRIWRQPDGQWRWRYVELGPDGEPEVALTGHRAFESFDEGRRSAAAAYPGIELRYEVRPDTDARAARKAPLWLVVAVVVLILVVRRSVRRAGQAHR